MKIDLTPLEKAITRLEEGLTRYQANTSDLQIQDGLIQRFEFTYEITHKMIKRYLEVGSPTPQQVEEADFPTLIRSANEQGLLRGDWVTWKQYRKMRGQTSHTYDEAVARDVVAEIPAFLDEARYLCHQIGKRTFV